VVVVAALALVAGGATSTVRAQTDTTRGVRIGLTYAPGTKPGVLVLPVNGEQGDSVRAILQRDLDYGDRMSVIAPEAVVMDSTSDGSRGQYNYPLYARLGAAAVLQLTATAAGVHVAVHDVAKQRVERVRDFPLNGAPLSPDWRMSLHAVSDEIESWLTPFRGIAATRILYVSGGRIWQIDSDGANPVALTPVESAMSPAWHPRGSHFAYARLTDAGVHLVLREMGGAARTLATGLLNATPCFAPDGSALLFQRGGENGSDLYMMNPFGNEPARRITVSRGRDAFSPTFSPDGRRIAFGSNRPGHPELYISDADGTNADVLTPFNFGDQMHRTSPDWAPDGRLIAFQAQYEGRFQIVTINPRDRSMKRYTSEGINEDPSWAPDSRHVVFSSDRSGSRQLWVLDIESNRVRQLTRAPSGARLAAWSPLLRGR
jgi:TolB protein